MLCSKVKVVLYTGKCAPGTYWVQRNDTCRACPLSTYRSDLDPVCQVCPGGHVTLYHGSTFPEDCLALPQLEELFAGKIPDSIHTHRSLLACPGSRAGLRTLPQGYVACLLKGLSKTALLLPKMSQTAAAAAAGLHMDGPGCGSANQHAYSRH